MLSDTHPIKRSFKKKKKKVYKNYHSAQKNMKKKLLEKYSNTQRKHQLFSIDRNYAKTNGSKIYAFRVSCIWRNLNNLTKPGHMLGF